MKSEHTEKKLKLDQLNELIGTTKNDLAAYNKIVQEITSIKIELSHLPKNQETPELKNLQSKLSLFTQKLNDNSTQLLLKKINEESDQIEKLEKELFGKSDRASPTFLTMRKL